MSWILFRFLWSLSIYTEESVLSDFQIVFIGFGFPRSVRARYGPEFGVEALSLYGLMAAEVRS